MNMEQPDGLQISRKVWKKAISRAVSWKLLLLFVHLLLKGSLIGSRFILAPTRRQTVQKHFFVVFFISLISTDADAGGDDKLLLRCSQFLATERKSSRAKSCLERGVIRTS